MASGVSDAEKRLTALARMKGAMRRLNPTPGDAKSDLLVVIASRLIMNDGGPITGARFTRSTFPARRERVRPVSNARPGPRAFPHEQP